MGSGLYLFVCTIVNDKQNVLNARCLMESAFLRSLFDSVHDSETGS